MTTDDAEGALLELASSLVDEVAAARALEAIGLAAGLESPPSARPRDWRTLSPRQLGLAESANPDYAEHGATPDRPGHADRRRHCEICGGTAGTLIPGADGEGGAWTCADERECEARKLRRYPPRPDLVPDAVLSAVGAADDAEAASAARQQAAQQQAVAEQAAAEQMASPRGWGPATPEGTWDEFGTWHPPLPAARPLVPPVPAAHRHTLAHCYGYQSRVHSLATYYGAASHIPASWHDAGSPQEEPGAAAPVVLQRGADGVYAAPAAASADELARRSMYEAARGRGSQLADVPMGQRPVRG